MIRLALALTLLASTAHAGSYDDNYCTVISAQDRVNSNGSRLTSVPQIIQNERANYHKNRHRDVADGADGTFDNTEYRAAIPNIMAENSVGPFLTEELLYGDHPVAICVMLQGGDMPDGGMQMEIWRSE